MSICLSDCVHKVRSSFSGRSFVNAWRLGCGVIMILYLKISVRYVDEGYSSVSRSPQSGIATPHCPPEPVPQHSLQTSALQTLNSTFTLTSASPPPQRLRPSMESGPVTCEVCKKVYKNRSTLYAHNNRDHGIKVSLMSAKQT